MCTIALHPITPARLRLCRRPSRWLGWSLSRRWAAGLVFGLPVLLLPLPLTRLTKNYEQLMRISSFSPHLWSSLLYMCHLRIPGR